jgi:hypothetical protein
MGRDGSGQQMDVVDPVAGDGAQLPQGTGSRDHSRVRPVPGVQPRDPDEDDERGREWAQH